MKEMQNYVLWVAVKADKIHSLQLLLPSIFLAKIIHNLSMNGSDVQVLSTAKKLMYLQTEIFLSIDSRIFFFSFQVFVQLLQFRYQSGVLYRLRALGISTKMDITLGKCMCLLQSLLNDQEPTFDI